MTDRRRQQMKLRSNTHGCELTRDCGSEDLRFQEKRSRSFLKSFAITGRSNTIGRVFRLNIPMDTTLSSCYSCFLILLKFNA